MSRFLAIVCCAVLMTACASSPREGAATAGSQSVITREEIAASGFANMEDVITRLRPQYLRGRGRTTIMGPPDEVAVYLDNSHLGNATALRGITASSVVRVEYISGPDTGFRFGMNHPAGVIHITTR
jgi:hypothetical protein